MNNEDIYKLRKSSADLFKKHNYSEALKSYSELIKQYTVSKEETELCKATHRQGVCYFLLSDYEKAFECFKRCEEIYMKDKLNNEPLFGSNLAYMSYCCMRRDELECGLEKASKAKEIFEKNKIVDDDVNAVLFSSLGWYHFKKGDNESAKKELERAEHFIKKHQHKKNLVNMFDLFNLAQIYLKENRIEDALDKFTESHNLSEELKYWEDKDYHITCLENISKLYYKLERDDVAQKFEKKLEDYKKKQ